MDIDSGFEVSSCDWSTGVAGVGYRIAVVAGFVVERACFATCECHGESEAVCT